jgi:transposase
VHRNARLTPLGRRTLIERIQQGRPVAHVAAEMGISRATAYKWWGRFRRLGWVGLEDRSSRPRRCPHQTQRQLERRIETLRRRRKLGPARIAGILAIAASTVHRVLVRLGLNRLRWFDRPTGRVVHHIETGRPGELVHIDVKKLGRIPPGGCHRMVGREARTGSVAKRGLGYAYIHSAVDAHSRVAYSEILDAENRATCTSFLARAHTWFTEHGIPVEHVLTDNGTGYRSNAWAELCTHLGIRHTRTRAYRPRPTAKSNASTGRSSTNGATSASTDPKPNECEPLTAGCTSTTITAPTPPSEARHPWTPSTTCLVNTPRAQMFGE